MSELTCAICFYDFNDKETKYSCPSATRPANPLSDQIANQKQKCNTLLCRECIEALITHSRDNNLIPSCPNPNCNEIYLLSCIKTISPDHIKDYEMACFNYFIKHNSDTVKKRIEENEMIETIRSERLKFIEQTFPKAISLVATLTFKDKIRQLDKQKRHIINMKLKNAQRGCLSLTCNGFMDADLVCMKCLTNFCKKCEKKINADHVCLQTDLDSICLVNGMIHCPGCRLPVFKNEGCDSITCANCETKFLYSTGQIGGHGSSNAKISVKVANPVLISVGFEKQIPSECLPLILQIESKKPVFKSKDILLIPIRNYLLQGNKDICASNLAKRLEQYTVAKYKNAQYHQYLELIGEILMSGKLENLQQRLNEIINTI